MCVMMGTGYGTIPTSVESQGKETRYDLVKPCQALRGYAAPSTATVASANRLATEQADAATQFTTWLETKT